MFHFFPKNPRLWEELPLWARDNLVKISVIHSTLSLRVALNAGGATLSRGFLDKARHDSNSYQQLYVVSTSPLS